MFKKMSLALLASASFLATGFHQAAAIEAGSLAEPTVIYADQGAPQPAPVRMAYAERSSMGGGFIEFLFGDGAAARRPLPAAGYQQAIRRSHPTTRGVRCRRWTSSR